MAESKFLRFQDKDGNNVNDVCPDIPFVPEKQCPTCEPNPSYIPPDWKIETVQEPWLNEKECTYYVAITTTEESAVPYDGSNDEEATSYIESLFGDYIDAAMASLFETYEKKNSLDNIQAAAAAITFSEYYLDVRHKSKLKLLYSIPHEDLNLLEAAAEEPEDSTSTGGRVMYVADDIYSQLQTLRKTLKMYQNYYQIYGFSDGGSLFFKEDGLLFSQSQLKRYGDKDYMMSILGNLDQFLNRNGYNITTGLGDAFNFNDKVERIDMYFSPEYVVEKMEIYTQGCKNIPILFDSKKLKFLTNSEVYKDATAMAYFSKLKKLNDLITAREPMPWIEFLIEHTYPQLEESFNWPFENEPAGRSGVNCVASALTNGAKQIGQDALDEGLSLVQAMIYQYSKNICEMTHEERIEQLKKANLLYDPAKNDGKTLHAYAVEQAYKELEKDDVTTQFCAALGIGSIVSNGDSPTNAMYEAGLDEMKLCGFNNMILEGIKCLVGGVSFEEFLAASTKAALKNMSFENFGELFKGLPPDKQAQIQATLQQKLNDGELFAEEGGIIGEDLKVAFGDELPSPWEDDSIVFRERTNPGTDPLVSDVGDRTLAQQVMLSDGASAFKKDTIMGMYAIAMLDVYEDFMLDLVDELNKFPGAKLAIDIIAAFDCPSPPIFEGYLAAANDNVNNTLAICKEKKPIKKPVFRNPQKPNINYKNWIGVFNDAAHLVYQRMLIIAITSSMKAVCTLVSSAACKALGATGSLAGSLVTKGNQTEIKDIIRDALCGSGASGFQVQQALNTLFGGLGLGAAALADQEALDSFIGDQSMALSRSELFEGFVGDMSDDTATIIDSLIETEYPQYRKALSNKDSIKTFYKNMGNVFPPDVKAGMKDFLNRLPDNDQMPASPSLCATPEDLENHCNMRAALLSGRATSAQAKAMCEADRAQRQQQIEDLAGLLDGFPELPPFVSDPGCDNGVLPYESPLLAQAAGYGLTSEFERLKLSYAKDMIGSGPFGDDWGMLNLILSDTAGWPLSVHHRKALYSRKTVDFITYKSAEEWWKLFPDPPATEQQRYAFPKSVAPWLRDQLGSLSVNFNATNDAAPDTAYSQSLGVLGADDINDEESSRLFYPEYGYNIDIATVVDANGTGSIVLTELARKKTPDLTLEFRDNCGGKAEHISSYKDRFNVGYDISLFLSDIENYSGDYANAALPESEDSRTPSDTTRIVIDELLNTDADVKTGLTNYMDDDQKDGFWASLLKPFNVEQNQIFEFVSVDDTLEAIVPTLEEYPNFASCFSSLQSYTPQVVLLDELLDKNASSPGKATLNTFRNNVINSFTSQLAAEISNNEDAWSYGAALDDLKAEDAEYLLGDNKLSGWVKEDWLDLNPEYYDEIPGDTPIGQIRVQAENEEEGHRRRLKNADGILGMSRDQYNNEVLNDTPENTRVYYLDPNKHGGSFKRPRIYIKPIQSKGWMGMAEVMFPELSPCKPSRSELVDFAAIGKDAAAARSSMTIDGRLQGEKECVEEQPYNKILDNSSAAGIQGVIKAACTTYASAHFLKTSAVFTKFYPSFPQTYSNIYAQYIVENMEMSFKDAQSDFYEFFNHFKDEEFWYAFLEQAVQAYARLVFEGKIPTPPKSVKRALDVLTAVQESYEFPTKNKFKELKDAKVISWATTLRKYREEKNWEAVRASEEAAKLILKEFVIMELNSLGKTFVENLKPMGRQPTYNNLGYYTLTHFSQGSSNLDLHKEIVKTTTDFPTSGNGYYSSGTEFAVKSTGDDYVGYYHVNIDDEGAIVFMAGEYHTEESHEVLVPMAGKVTVPIGDIAEYNGSESYDLGDESTPFVVEKYISINGSRKNPTTALNTIKANNPEANLSDIYPGTMQPVMAEDGITQVGIHGEMGVRYGLLFSVGINGSKYELASVEIDALDLPISQTQPLAADTELLFCLINHLVEDEKFKLAYEYIFGINKTLALLAIYTDLGFLPSIGEFTAPAGADRDGFYSDKPGMKVTFPNAASGDYTPDYSQSTETWYNTDDRIDQWFVRTWDEWDKVLLGNTKSRLKSMFKNYYFSRHWDPSFGWPSFNFMEWMMKNMKSAMFPSPAKGILPWWKRNRIRPNPFDADGNECDKS